MHSQLRVGQRVCLHDSKGSVTEEVRRWKPGVPNSVEDTLEHQFWGLRNVDEAILRRIDRNGNGLPHNPPNPSTNFAGDTQSIVLVDSNMSVVEG